MHTPAPVPFVRGFVELIRTRTGTIIETQRYINVPMRFCERYLARERRKCGCVIWMVGRASG